MPPPSQINILESKAAAANALITLNSEGRLKGRKHILLHDLNTMARCYGNGYQGSFIILRSLLAECGIHPREANNQSRTRGYHRKQLRTAVKDGRMAALLSLTRRRIADLKRPAPELPPVPLAELGNILEQLRIESRDRQAGVIILNDDPNEQTALEAGYDG